MSDAQRESMIAWHSERLQAHFTDGHKALARWHHRMFTGLIKGRSPEQVGLMEKQSFLEPSKSEISHGAR